MSKNIVIDKTSEKDIPKRPSGKDKQMVFSFELFDRTQVEDFNLGKTEKDWFVTFLDELKLICEKTVTDFWNNKKWDLHPWSETSKRKYSFSSVKYGEDIENLQFRLDKSHGRVNGFIIDSVFYIVWLDPDHKMTDSDGYNNKGKYHVPKTSYEEAMDIVMSLRKENRELKSKINSSL